MPTSSATPPPEEVLTTDVELRLTKATGTLKLFPYPMHDLTCLVKIRDSFLEIENLQMNQNGASLKLDGKVSFSRPDQPSISTWMHAMSPSMMICSMPCRPPSDPGSSGRASAAESTSMAACS